MVLYLIYLALNTFLWLWNHFELFLGDVYCLAWFIFTCALFLQIWPPKSVQDSGSRLHSLLKEAIMQVRSMLGSYIFLREVVKWQSCKLFTKCFAQLILVPLNCKTCLACIILMCSFLAWMVVVGLIFCSSGLILFCFSPWLWYSSLSLMVGCAKWVFGEIFHLISYIGENSNDGWKSAIY